MKTEEDKKDFCLKHNSQFSSFFIGGNMYGNYNYNSQANIDRINSQIAELEKIKSQLQQPAPTNLTQNFQIAPTNRDVIHYANSINEVEREQVYGETPYFSKDMSVLWVKNRSGEIKSYELREIVQKDEKDLKIDFLQAQIEELKKGMSKNARTDDTDVDDTIKDEKPTDVQLPRTSTKKSK